MAITDYLLRHQATNPVSFHMPGHKGSRLFRRLGYDAFLDNIVDIDITEIPGADNLFVGVTEENRLLAVKCAVKAVQAPFTISTVQ